MAILERAKTNSQSAAKNKERNIEFTYYAPQAKKVCLAGKFNAWDTSSLPMKKGRDGTWKTTIKLAPGRHEYKYFVDGAWVHEALCSDKVPNPFGTYNCVVGVQ